MAGQSAGTGAVWREMAMNFGAEMMPGITLLVVGAFLGFFADGVCRNKKNVQPMRMLGVFLAIAGALMVFIV